MGGEGRQMVGKAREGRGCGVKEGPGRKDLRTFKWTGRGMSEKVPRKGLLGSSDN